MEDRVGALEAREPRTQRALGRIESAVANMARQAAALAAKLAAVEAMAVRIEARLTAQRSLGRIVRDLAFLTAAVAAGHWWPR